VAKRLNKFTDAFQNSRIPFLLAEVITDGQGAMVDLVLPGLPMKPPPPSCRCRWSRSQGQRFTRAMPAQRIGGSEGSGDRGLLRFHRFLFL